MTDLQRLNDYCEKEKISQTDIIKSTSRNQSTISNLFSGTVKSPRLDLVIDIIKATDISPAWWLFGVGPEKLSEIERPIINADKEFQEAVLDFLEARNELIEASVQDEGIKAMLKGEHDDMVKRIEKLEAEVRSLKKGNK